MGDLPLSQDVQAVSRDGNQNSQANPFYVQISDGTSAAVVKAASTAPTATDPALVVALSPNSILGTAASPGFVKVTDGTNTLPTMDAPARRAYVQITDGTDNALVDASTGALNVALPALVSSGNSTTTPLVAGGSFTGTAEDVTLWATARVTVYSDKNGNVSEKSLFVEQSTDGTNWDVSDYSIVLGGSVVTVEVRIVARYFRVRYTNATSTQTVFRLQTVYSAQVSAMHGRFKRFHDPTISYHAATAPITGTVAAQNLLTIENPSSSTRILFVKRMSVTCHLNAQGGQGFDLRLGRTSALPSGGTTLTAQKAISMAPTPQAILRQEPTASAAAGAMTSFMQPVGVGVTPTWSCVPMPIEMIAWGHDDENDILLFPGEALLLSTGGGTTDRRFSVTVYWMEGNGL